LGRIYLVHGKVGRNAASSDKLNSGFIVGMYALTSVNQKNYRIGFINSKPYLLFDRFLKGVIGRHYSLTASPRAKTILSDWEEYHPLFVKVTPR